MVLGVTLFPLAKAGSAILPKTTIGTITNFFGGTSGKIASTSLKIGGGIAGGGILASIGLGSFGSSLEDFAKKSGLDPKIILLGLAVLAIFIFIMVMKKR